jgi:integrase/recombinase XerC
MLELYKNFVEAFDFSIHTKRAFLSDLKKFAGWFENKNKEPITLERITMRDVADYRNHLQNNERKAVATVNRCLVTIRRFLQWTVDQNLVNTNVAKGVKEIRKQSLTPQSLLPEDIRRLLREVELRGDIRSLTLFTLFLYTGARVSDIVGTELIDIKMTERNGSILFRHGKGNKQRTVPLPLIARQAIMKYLEVRPKSNIPNLFLGERGTLTEKGIRNLCKKYGNICNIPGLHPHNFRHSFCHNYLEKNNNDIVGLAQVVGHSSIETTSRYTQKRKEELDNASENIEY